ncbi:UBX domain-containing protein 6-like [Haliotis cracherodii]|uniref:UBX domain-containing protein 6-like n=1 Tax=Haliotis cracherodii TaxID=6455 RepID=UPI0039E9B8FE
MAAIKRFFQKKKLDVKFKKAGEGHKLTEERQAAPRPTGQMFASGSNRPQTTVDAKRAGEAALARFESEKTTKDDQSFQLARVRMKKQMEAEKKALEEAEASGASYRAEPTQVVQDSAPVLADILFKCPEIGPVVLPKMEMEAYIHEYLLGSLVEEPEMTSALMIHTLNKNKDKVKVGIDTLLKYIDNILAHPGEEKYSKIRVNNKAFQERVASLEGTHEFLQSARFNVTALPFEDHEEQFYVMSTEDSKEEERLKNLKDVLLAAEPLRPQLDRALKVFHASSSASKFVIPDEFYNITPEELKKEQQRQTEAVEKLGMLRTKAMRERDEQRELRRYRYALLRVRFPNGIMLQGTFRTVEKLQAIYEFIRENLHEDWMPFQLITSTGQKLTEDAMTIAEAGLAPAAVVNFSWDPTVMAEIAAQKGKTQEGNYLKSDVIALIQSL